MYYVPKKIYPETAAIFGVFSLLLSFLIGFISVKELLILPSQPQHMSIAEALSKVPEKRLWVILDDIQWDCDHVFYFEGNKGNDDTYIVFTDKNKVILGLALFGGKKDCKAIAQNEIPGVLDVDVLTKNGRLYLPLTKSGFDVSLHEKNGTLLSLCTYCGRNNSLTGVALSVIVFIMGIFLFIPLVKAENERKFAQRFMKRNILRL